MTRQKVRKVLLIRALASLADLALLVIADYVDARRLPVRSYKTAVSVEALQAVEVVYSWSDPIARAAKTTPLSATCLPVRLEPA